MVKSWPPQIYYATTPALPSFRQSAARADPAWRVAPLPPRLRRRNVDVGDVSPADTQRLTAALEADVDGVQVCCDWWRHWSRDPGAHL